MEPWTYVGLRSDIPRQGARTVALGDLPVAVFRTIDDTIYAIVDRCPHKGGPLSQGIVHGHAVSCPLHNWNISLSTGQALGEDKGCTRTIPVRLDGERILISHPSARADRAA